MKNILFISICLFLFACKPEIVKQDYKGKAKAIKNGKKWKALAGAKMSPINANLFSLSFAMYDAHFILKESIYVGSIPINMNMVSIKESSDSISAIGSFGILKDGDLLYRIYHPLDNSSNMLTITKLDKSKGIVEGKFELTVVKDTSFSHDELDTIRFTEGCFSTEFSE